MLYNSIVADRYDADYLQQERPKPLSDNQIEALIQTLVSEILRTDISDKVYDDFKSSMFLWLLNSNLNRIKGFEKFNYVDICTGCTQFIDNLYMQGKVQVIHNEYRYHERLNPDIKYSSIDNLIPNVPLILSLPFPAIGDVHPDTNFLLETAVNKNVDVHIDAAWLTCSRDIYFDFDHPAIKSFAISLSKGLGLGWNRVALRWRRDNLPDSISIMNNFRMLNRAPVIIALKFLQTFSSDHLWNQHAERYYKVCKDFDLTPTKSIHIALKKGKPVGISPLIRYLENHG